jgi:hypothetical protein
LNILHLFYSPSIYVLLILLFYQHNLFSREPHPTHLIIDALISPYKIGERRRAIKLLRQIGQGMLLMWDRGLHSYRMVYSALKQKAHILGRVPANVKFQVVKPLDDGSYLSWIAPDRKSKKKGATTIKIRVIEYIILVDYAKKI